VSVSDFLTLFSARTGTDFFWATAPSPILLAAGGVALSASSILACTWPSSSPDNIYSLGLGLRKPYVLALYIWIYCIVWWFIQDTAKVVMYKIVVKYNLLGWNSTGKVVLPESTLKYIRDNKEKDLAALHGHLHHHHAPHHKP
jgi:H+-transporting ATPase